MSKTVISSASLTNFNRSCALMLTKIAKQRELVSKAEPMYKVKLAHELRRIQQRYLGYRQCYFDLLKEA